MEHTDRDALLDSSTELNDHGTTRSSENSRELPGLVQIEPCYLKKIFSASSHSIVQTLIGVNVGVSLWFAFKSTPITKFQLHVGLCVLGLQELLSFNMPMYYEYESVICLITWILLIIVQLIIHNLPRNTMMVICMICFIDYQLLMAHGFLCFRSTSWPALSMKHRRRLHWILQLSGSTLAIAGSALMFKSKNEAGKSHFSSTHGKLALAAFVFTCASLVNGLLSFYSVELRHLIPAKASKLCHILFGTAAFVTSSACLATGFNKKSFVEWGSQEFSYVMIGIVSVYTTLIVVLPLTNVLKKILDYWKIKICWTFPFYIFQ